MKNHLVPFKVPETFERFGIDWTKAETEADRALREAFLTYETSWLQRPDLAGTFGSRLSPTGSGGGRSGRRGSAEVMLAMQLRKHVDDALACVQLFLENRGSVWDAAALKCRVGSPAALFAQTRRLGYRKDVRRNTTLESDRGTAKA